MGVSLGEGFQIGYKPRWTSTNITPYFMLQRHPIDAEETWHCYRVAQKKEHLVAESARRELGLDVFCPRISEVKKTKLGYSRFTNAMFAGYLFVRKESEITVSEMVRFRGVTGIVRYATHVPSVPAVFIHGLRKELENDILYVDEEAFDEGESVEVQAGPLAGMIGRVIDAKSEGERVSVLLDFIGRSVEVKIPKNNLTSREGVAC